MCTTTSSSPSNAVCVHEGMVTLNLHPGAAMTLRASAIFRWHHSIFYVSSIHGNTKSDELVCMHNRLVLIWGEHFGILMFDSFKYKIARLCWHYNVISA